MATFHNQPSEVMDERLAKALRRHRGSSRDIMASFQERMIKVENIIAEVLGEVMDASKSVKGLTSEEEFKDEFQQQFYLECAEDEARAKLRHLKHKGDLLEYVMMFSDLMLQIPSMNDKEAFFQFTDGLKLWAEQELQHGEVLRASQSVLVDMGASNLFIFREGAEKLGLHIAEGYEPKMACKTRYGSNEYLVMPFGPTNTPATFGTLMNKVLQPFIENFVVVYLGDIVVYSRSLAEHVEHLQLVFQALRENKLRVTRGVRVKEAQRGGAMVHCPRNVNDHDSALHSDVAILSHWLQVREADEEKYYCKPRREYLIHWKGLPETEASWESAEDLWQFTEEIEAFHAEDTKRVSQD
ncbi:hypothetical protein CRG98_009094 [Punica granatum]|uniref:Chromo domain-containing protein n=1 Tax=Punica granatum TaxID=22663 RepID=A0A2I0KQ73_PUNGR|nr:hypothetical protein CRG98_009094 [Punica granatum]